MVGVGTFRKKIVKLWRHLASVGAGTALLSCVGAPRYHGPPSDHFDGEHFKNLTPAPSMGPGALLKWMAHREQGPWTPAPAAPPGPKPVPRVGMGGLRVTWINHATALIQMEGLNILTDPIWSERCSPVSFAGPKRAHPPGVRFEDLPPIDLVLISHNHYDHLDLATVRRLEEAFHPRFFTGLGNAKLLERAGIRGAQELDWWQSTPASQALTVTSVPAQHFSNRGLIDRDVSLWTGFVLSAPSGNVYFAGDTGYGPKFEQIQRRFGAIRLALLPIGAYRPEWFMEAIHISPEGAVRAHLALHALTSVAIHHGTFALGDDGQKEPAEELARALGRLGVLPEKFWVLDFGEGRDVPPL